MLSIAQVKDAEKGKDIAATEKGISFKHEAWADILKLAKAENKLIFVDCYTSWCGPCKMLAKTVFRDAKVGLLMNSKFINVKMDMEKGEGIDIRSKYDIKAYPTLLFINSDEEVEHRIVGVVSSDDFIKGANDVLSGKGLAIYMKKYKNGVRDTTFLREYIQLMSYADLQNEAADATLELFQVKGMNYMQTSNGWKLFNTNISDPYSPLALYFWDNLPLLAEKVGKGIVEEKIVSICTIYAKKFISINGDKYDFDEVGFNKFLEFIKSKGVKNTDDAKFSALLNIYYAVSNWGGFADLVDNRMKMGCEVSLDLLQMYSNIISKMCLDTSVRLRAVRWVELAIKKASESESSKKVLPTLAKLKEELKIVKK